MAGFVLMRRILRDDVARELTFTGREFTGTDALNLGVATRLATDPLMEALGLARDIASRSPHAVRAGKRLFQLAADADDKTILLNETLEQQRLLGSPNQMEAVAAGVARRPPRFSDL
jgi:enoyl-CoA hydratase/carnithine racemase